LRIGCWGRYLGLGNRGVEKSTQEELYDLYYSPNIVRMIKSRIMRWAEHVARMGKRIGIYRVLVRRFEGKRPLSKTKT
jgi:hypothetical protein